MFCGDSTSPLPYTSQRAQKVKDIQVCADAYETKLCGSSILKQLKWIVKMSNCSLLHKLSIFIYFNSDMQNYQLVARLYWGCCQKMPSNHWDFVPSERLSASKLAAWWAPWLRQQGEGSLLPSLTYLQLAVPDTERKYKWIWGSYIPKLKNFTNCKWKRWLLRNAKYY